MHQGVGAYWYNWKAVAELVGTKTETEVKDFFDSKRGTGFFPTKKWSKEEKKKATKWFVPGAMNYERVAKDLPNKTRHQIEKWYTTNRQHLLKGTQL